ncbi:hypothetical protein [Trichlorobacter sp.]|uniref:hypothetical protein n=1 Tax=Trichlorobacter sp. TaxID=2911007 RepID=UPI002A359528|nr:hypothetical protein [Trichlorobacter sp.]MDY0385385.1 hypothetical protein [Trichlorobacter sp.]
MRSDFNRFLPLTQSILQARLLICNHCSNAFYDNNHSNDLFISSLKKINNDDDIILVIKYSSTKKYLFSAFKLILLISFIAYVPAIIKKYDHSLFYLIIKLSSLIMFVCLICYSFLLTITFKALYISRKSITKETYVLKPKKMNFEQLSFKKVLGANFFFDKSKSNMFFKNGIGLENYLLDRITKSRLPILFEYISGRPAVSFSKYNVTLNNFIKKVE